MTTQEILEAARGAKTAVALSYSGTRDSALLGMADALCADVYKRQAVSFFVENPLYTKPQMAKKS